MIYTIQNKQLRVQISDFGAELMSIQTADGCEYLWQGNPEFWASRASNLFPICGRLTGGKYTCDGQTYEMNLHGFARHMAMTAEPQGEDRIAFHLSDSEQTRAQYPFHFALTISYELEGATLRETFTVHNPSDKTVLPFAVGGHPGFNVPLEAGEHFEDYYVEFDTVEPVQRVVMSDACLDTGRRVPFALEDGTRLPLRHTLFDNDAIFLTEMSSGITLKSHKCNRTVHLSYPQMNALGLWHKPHTEAPYVCIEPWYSLPAYDGEVDDIHTKHLMVHLQPNRTYTNTFAITIG